MEYFNDDETVFYDVYLSDYLKGLDDSFQTFISKYYNVNNNKQVDRNSECCIKPSRPIKTLINLYSQKV